MIPGYSVMGYIQSRQGHWEESTRNLERAIELDPRNLNTLGNIADSYGASGVMLNKNRLRSRVDYRAERCRGKGSARTRGIGLES